MGSPAGRDQGVTEASLVWMQFGPAWPVLFVFIESRSGGGCGVVAQRRGARSADLGLNAKRAKTATEREKDWIAAKERGDHERITERNQGRLDRFPRLLGFSEKGLDQLFLPSGREQLCSGRPGGEGNGLPLTRMTEKPARRRSARTWRPRRRGSRGMARQQCAGRR